MSPQCHLESLLASCCLLLSSLPATCSCSSETYSFRPVRPFSWLLLLTLQLQIPSVELGFNTIDEAACLRPSIYPSMHCNATRTVQSDRGQEQSLILPLYPCTLSCYIFMDLKISIFSQGDKGPWIITIFLLASLDIIYYLIIVRKARPGLVFVF